MVRNSVASMAIGVAVRLRGRESELRTLHGDMWFGMAVHLAATREGRLL